MAEANGGISDTNVQNPWFRLQETPPFSNWYHHHHVTHLSHSEGVKWEVLMVGKICEIHGGARWTDITLRGGVHPGGAGASSITLVGPLNTGQGVKKIYLIPSEHGRLERRSQINHMITHIKWHKETGIIIPIYQYKKHVLSYSFIYLPPTQIIWEEVKDISPPPHAQGNIKKGIPGRTSGRSWQDHPLPYTKSPLKQGPPILLINTPRSTKEISSEAN